MPNDLNDPKMYEKSPGKGIGLIIVFVMLGAVIGGVIAFFVYTYFAISTAVKETASDMQPSKVVRQILEESIIEPIEQELAAPKDFKETNSGFENALEESEEIEAGDGKCVLLYRADENKRAAAGKKGYMTSNPMWQGGAPESMTSSCISNSGTLAVLIGDDMTKLETETSPWVLEISETGIGDWNIYKFDDPLPFVYGHTCEITELIEGDGSAAGSPELNHVIITCISGDGGIYTRNTYSWSKADDAVTRLSTCDGHPVIITHPKTFDTLIEDYEEICKYFN